MQEFGVASYTLLMSLIEYKTLVLREEHEAASQLLPSIPKASTACLQDLASLLCAHTETGSGISTCTAHRCTVCGSCLES